ncbi:MAG: hypothetical protein J6I64_04055 [Lachnospiraceae bacterium]|nr:hypothetical protein [Lachnospiraceae bacterium]
MKRKRWYGITVIVIVCAILGLVLMKRNDKNRAAKWIEINLPAHEEMMYLDNHGGFHGDGETVMILTFSKQADEKLRERMEASSVWQTFPMTTNLHRCIYGSKEPAITYVSCVQQTKFPEITNGYWFFLDRQADEESLDRYRDDQLLSRPSMNCVAALYDADTRTLYYWKFDT